MVIVVKKKQFFILAFLTAFLVYAVSPLTYVLPGRDPREELLADDGAYPAVQRVQVLLWELMIDSMSSSAHKAAHEPQHGTILIRKKRAIVSEDESGKPPRCMHVSSVQGAVARRGPHPPDGLRPIFSGIHKGFHPLYAGHSPPSVQRFRT